MHRCLSDRTWRRRAAGAARKRRRDGAARGARALRRRGAAQRRGGSRSVRVGRLGRSSAQEASRRDARVAGAAAPARAAAAHSRAPRRRRCGEVRRSRGASPAVRPRHGSGAIGCFHVPARSAAEAHRVMCPVVISRRSRRRTSTAADLKIPARAHAVRVNSRAFGSLAKTLVRSARRRARRWPPAAGPAQSGPLHRRRVPQRRSERPRRRGRDMCAACQDCSLGSTHRRSWRHPAAPARRPRQQSPWRAPAAPRWEAAGQERLRGVATHISGSTDPLRRPLRPKGFRPCGSQKATFSAGWPPRRAAAPRGLARTQGAKPASVHTSGQAPSASAAATAAPARAATPAVVAPQLRPRSACACASSTLRAGRQAARQAGPTPNRTAKRGSAAWQLTVPCCARSHAAWPRRLAHAAGAAQRGGQSRLQPDRAAGGRAGAGAARCAAQEREET